MRSILCIIFFLSGASALIFEALWFRQTGIAFGNSVWGAALVMSAFMGGLALGNGLAARYGNRFSRPIFAYAVMEIAIAVTGLTLVLVLPALAGWLAPVFRPIIDMPLLLNSLRLSIAFGLMLIPTTAMGVTLPLLTKALSSYDKNFGSVLGKLYGWNTMGAVLGVLAAEIVLIKWLGITGSGLLAAFLNLFAAFVALRIEKTAAAQVNGLDSEPVKLPERSKLSPRVKRLLFGAFLSGAVMLALEVIWFRFLLLFKDGTTAAFAVMLGITLAGIGIGGLIASLWFKYRPSAHHFLRVFILLGGILTVVTYRAVDWTFAFMLSRGYFEFQEFVFVAFFLLMPVSMVSGLIFTMLGHAVKEEIALETRAAGLVTFANTIGAMSGTFIAGFILLPKAGMEKSFFLLALVYGVTAFIIPAVSGPRYKIPRLLSYTMAAVFLVSIWLFPFGIMKDTYFINVGKKYYDFEGSKIAAIREGLLETVIYMRKDRFDEPLYHRLLTNGFGMSGDMVSAKRYMKLYVYWPVAVHPDLKRALLISYGVGSTAKALTDTKNLESIDIVDISPEILEMSSIVYPDPDAHPLNDERVRVHIEDGRFFLQTTDLRFDLITGEPPPPKHKGVVNLYSQEYFQLIYDRLAEGGMVTYWLPNHLLYDEESKSVIKGFCNVFKDCSLWAGAGLDWMLVGSRNAAGGVSMEHFSRQWQDPVVRPELLEAGLETPEQLGSLFIADALMLKQFTEKTLPLTDNFPMRISAKQKFGGTYSVLFDAMMNETEARERFRQSAFIDLFWPEEMKNKSMRYFEYERMIKSYFQPRYRDKKSYILNDLHSVLTRTSLQTLPLWMLDTEKREQEIVDQLIEEGVHITEMQLLLGKRAIAERSYTKAVEFFESYITSGNEENMSHVYTLYLYALCMDGKTDKAENVAREIASTVNSSKFDQLYVGWMNAAFGVNIPQDQK